MVWGAWKKLEDGEKRRLFKVSREKMRAAYIASDGDFGLYKKIVKKELREQYGSIVIYVTIAAALLQIAYTLFRFWKDLNHAPARIPTEAEVQYLIEKGWLK